MIICSNCGATNNESEGRICRKCGALLPTASRAPRMRIGTSATPESTPTEPAPSLQAIQTEVTPQEKKQSTVDPRGQRAIFSPKKEEPSVSSASNLQDIPQIVETTEIQHAPQLKERPKVKGLQEIAPQPYKGSILAQRGGYGGQAEKPDNKFSQEQ